MPELVVIVCALLAQRCVHEAKRSDVYSGKMGAIANGDERALACVACKFTARLPLNARAHVHTETVPTQRATHGNVRVQPQRHMLT